MESRELAELSELPELYRRVRGRTLALCEPLALEDMVVQSLPEASPTKWHLAHTSWYFETFVLRPALDGYRPIDERYRVLFNSYYNAVGASHPRPERGHLSRPTVEQVLAYRRHVDDGMQAWFARAAASAPSEVAFAVELGVNHEEQHQELLLTDVKHALATNPLEPVYRRRHGEPALEASAAVRPASWLAYAGGLVDVGDAGDGFAFDNERPRHRRWQEPFELAHSPVTCGEYAAFLADGGYARPELWLSDGWELARARGWRAPLYWSESGGAWQVATLAGRRAVDPAEPVCHVSYYEADAYARWAGARLPTEFEWELAASALSVRGNLLEQERFHPAPAERMAPAERTAPADRPAQMYGDVWEWTASTYAPYPRFAPFAGNMGEYNGKFMSGRFVLRGGSCVTPERHLRASYRNFFAPDTRWQFSGIRLARSER